MLGGTSQVRSAMTARMASMRLVTPLHSSRSLSSIAVRSLQSPTHLGQGFSRSAGNPMPSASRLAFARFNSTSTTATAASTTAGSAADAAFQVEPTNAADLSDLDIYQIPEKIGYLQELGLNFGWGPSSIIEWIIEHCHMYTGLPWWASIAATGIIIRLALLKPTITAADTSVKLQKLSPETDSIRRRMTQAARVGDSLEMATARAELQELYKAHGVAYWKSFGPFIQIPFGFAAFRVVRAMVSLPVPALELEHFAWISNLTLRDPYFILPLATSVLMFISIKKAGEAGSSVLFNSAFGRLTIYGLPAISFIVMLMWPAAMQLYFVSSSLGALGQTYLLNSPSFRNWAKLTPLPTKGDPSPAQDSLEKREVRMVEAALKREAKKQWNNSPIAALKSPIQFIRNVVSATKDNFKNAVREVREKMGEISGQGPAKNDDGSVIPTRLSKQDLKIAGDYHRRRQQEEDALRDERNYTRRQDHLKALEREREKAARTWPAKKGDTKVKRRQS